MLKTIREIYNLNKHNGDVGIEIEVEGENLPRAVTGWKAVPDGSLRGEALEYVTRTGVTVDNIDKRIDTLVNKFQKNGGIINNSVRAGVHVHINVQELTHTQVACFATLYYTFEDVLLKYCGDSREGNLFCLRACDADYVITYLLDSFNIYGVANTYSDKIRYSAMNWKPLTRYGSLEFRSMRTDPDLDSVRIWTKMLYQLLQASLKYDSPTDIIADFSIFNPQKFLENTFREFTQYLSLDGIDLYQGCCNAQDLAFGVDWEKFENSLAEQYKAEQKALKNPFDAKPVNAFIQAGGVAEGRAFVLHGGDWEDDEDEEEFDD